MSYLQEYNLEAEKKGLVNPYICINRFYAPSNRTFKEALQEVKDGKKKGHWMWWTFPQMKGLGKTERSFFYGLSGQEEAKAFINDPILGPRLIEICQEIFNSKVSVYKIFGNDTIKVRACCKLFAEITEKDSIFHKILKKYMWY